MTRKELMEQLKAKGIKCSTIASKAELEALLNPEEEAPEEQKEEVAEQLVTVIQNLAQNLQLVTQDLKTMKNELAELKKPVNPVENVLSITKPAIAMDPFFNQVPANLEKAALEVLGNKFTFECVSHPDQPAFNFSVVVPPEYSTLKGEQVDRRTKVIPNVLGANGVRDWCQLVKQNVIKCLGQQITVN